MRKRLYPEEAKYLGLEVSPNEEGRKQSRYTIDEDEWEEVKVFRSNIGVVTETKTNDYNEEKPFVISAWGSDGRLMDIDKYCEHYNLPRKSIGSYKLVTHTSVPYYNLVFKPSIDGDGFSDIDFEAIAKKYINKIDVVYEEVNATHDFDVTTYTDAHIGMDTNKDKNSMYADLWNRYEALKVAKEIVKHTIENKKSDILIVDDLGDLADGLHARTTRGGHELPQNMSNEEAFDCCLEFKMTILDGLIGKYRKITFNNVCNDNHSGVLSYFINQYFKSVAELKYHNVEVNNHRTFLSHYIVNDIGFVISHGKDDKTLKFGFKPALDTKQIEKIDQYCKQNGLYQKCKRIIFKKGDSHQFLFDMAGSDDFDYYNYPACSPSSQWVQNNFKKGRRGFVIENFKGLENSITPVFRNKLTA